MRAILIDPFSKTVTQVECAPGIEAIYALIDADCFCTVNLDDAGNAVYLDDEGLFREGQEFFALGNYPQPLAGRGLILGCNEEGESVATTITVEQVRAAVRWLSPAAAVSMNRNAVAEMEAHAALENARGGSFHIVAAPLLELDPETGKAKVGGANG